MCYCSLKVVVLWKSRVAFSTKTLRFSHMNMKKTSLLFSLSSTAFQLFFFCVCSLCQTFIKLCAFYKYMSHFILTRAVVFGIHWNGFIWKLDRAWICKELCLNRSLVLSKVSHSFSFWWWNGYFLCAPDANTDIDTVDSWKFYSNLNWIRIASDRYAFICDILTFFQLTHPKHVW